MKRIKRKNAKKKITIIAIIVAILWLFGFYIYVTYSKIEIKSGNYEATKVQSTESAQTVEKVEEKSQTIADIIEETTKSVVGISKLKSAGNSILSNSNESELGLGTGIIVAENGYILSNAHVTGERYSKCYITLENGQNYEGKVMWSDENLDLSITKIEAKNLSYATLGDSSKIRVGETVYAIGNPIGFEFRRTVTSGIISAKNRSIKIEEENNQTYMSDLIQTDATINPGNSGGPLITPNGEVIGINTVKISTAEGIGFAIPINVVKTIIESYKQTGTYEQATIGIYAYDKDVIPYLDTNVKFEKGIYVAQIAPKGAADGSELEEKDIIVSIDDKELNTMNELREYIYTKKPGDQVTLKIIRKKITKNINITLGKKWWIRDGVMFLGSEQKNITKRKCFYSSAPKNISPQKTLSSKIIPHMFICWR